MELASFLKAVMLFMFNSTSDHPHKANNLESVSTEAPSLPVTTYERTISDREITALASYNYDCSMPYPPSVVESPTPPMTPDSETFDKSDENAERPHAKATFSIPIHIVHRLPDSAILNLQR